MVGLSEHGGGEEDAGGEAAAVGERGRGEG